MSWLLFIDESGHDHKNTPYEVRGGIALHADKLWSFIQNMQRLERDCFGAYLHEYKTEIKGHKLLDKDRFKWAAQDIPLNDLTRLKNARSFLSKGIEKKPPNKLEFTAYGQACIMMARGIYQLLHNHDAKLFAIAIPRNVTKPKTVEADEYLRKDQVFLLERFFYFLEEPNQQGLIVIDEIEQSNDRRFVKRLERYFTSTSNGQSRSERIVPSPFFVSSAMTYPLQAADVCIYCVNWGFRIPRRGMNAPTRAEIEREFSGLLGSLQFKGLVNKLGKSYKTYGIAYVPDPYTQRMSETDSTY
jgi:hypothetical protein